MSTTPSRTRIVHHPAVLEERGLEPKAVREALAEVIAKIPDEDLRNFRAGDVLIVK